VSEDFYHDDPIEEVSKTKVRSKFLSTAVVVVGSIFFFQSTLAGNISLNSNQGIEFGQGVSQTVACSGETSLTLTPRSNFDNGSPGAHYLQSVTVSNIPTSCRGADFTIRAYSDSSSTPLSLFDTNSKTATIETIDTPGTSNDSATAWAGAAGMSVSASSTGDAFTVTFTTPAALSSDVSKITLESSKPYYYGGPGPGGGTVFYVSTTGFNCGASFTARCKYLEAARALWNAGAVEPKRRWANSTYQSTTVNNASAPETSTATAIGWGYRNTRAIILQGNTDSTTSAAALADFYSVTVRGIAIDDWYLPSLDELNQMCKWQQGRPWVSDATVCTVGTPNSGPGAAGFITTAGTSYYYSSSEKTPSIVWIQSFGGANQENGDKSSTVIYVRPIRAF
jgi:hypothetical protein